MHMAGGDAQGDGGDARASCASPLGTPLSAIHLYVKKFGESTVVDPHHLDADPYSTYHPDADPDSDFYLMRIRMRIRIFI